jgi:hypothetical protein
VPFFKWYHVSLRVFCVLLMPIISEHKNHNTTNYDILSTTFVCVLGDHGVVIITPIIKATGKPHLKNAEYIFPSARVDAVILRQLPAKNMPPCGCTKSYSS